MKGEGPGAELVRAIRKIAQVEGRLKAIDAEIARLEESDLYNLKNQVIKPRRKDVTSWLRWQHGPTDNLWRHEDD